MHSTTFRQQLLSEGIGWPVEEDYLHRTEKRFHINLTGGDISSKPDPESIYRILQISREFPEEYPQPLDLLALRASLLDLDRQIPFVSWDSRNKQVGSISLATWLRKYGYDLKCFICP